MTPETRFKYLRVVGDHPDRHAIAHRLHYLDCHFPEHKLDAAITWLIRANLTGARFVQWVDGELHGSNLELHRELLKRIEHSNEKLRQIMAGRDFRIGNA